MPLHRRRRPKLKKSAEREFADLCESLDFAGQNGGEATDEFACGG
jgi:hypothetical protein